MVAKLAVRDFSAHSFAGNVQYDGHVVDREKLHFLLTLFHSRILLLWFARAAARSQAPARPKVVTRTHSN